jgi:hypothetical protein
MGQLVVEDETVQPWGEALVSDDRLAGSQTAYPMEIWHIPAWIPETTSLQVPRMRIGTRCPALQVRRICSQRLAVSTANNGLLIIIQLT